MQFEDIETTLTAHKGTHKGTHTQGDLFATGNIADGIRLAFAMGDWQRMASDPWRSGMQEIETVLASAPHGRGELGNERFFRLVRACERESLGSTCDQ